MAFVSVLVEETEVGGCFCMAADSCTVGGPIDPGTRAGAETAGSSKHLPALSLLLFCPIYGLRGTLARTSKQPLYIHSPCVSLQSLCPYIRPLSPPLHVFEALCLTLSATVESSASFPSGWESPRSISNKQPVSFVQEKWANILSE